MPLQSLQPSTPGIIISNSAALHIWLKPLQFRSDQKLKICSLKFKLNCLKLLEHFTHLKQIIFFNIYLSFPPSSSGFSVTNCRAEAAIKESERSKSQIQVFKSQSLVKEKLVKRTMLPQQQGQQKYLQIHREKMMGMDNNSVV